MYDMKYEQQFVEKFVPKRFANATLETCDKQPKGLIELAKVWAKKPEPILLMGSVGLGKTYFAFSMVREAIRQHPTLWPEYYTSTHLDGMLLAAVRDEKELYEIERLGNRCELLFIDDFGRETRSDRMKRQYFELINLRYANLLPTVISTNLTIDEINVGWGEAVASRFQEFQLVLFKGRDLRSKGKQVDTHV